MVNISILNFQRFISLLYFFIKFTPTSFISITAIVDIITKKGIIATWGIQSEMVSVKLSEIVSGVLTFQSAL